MVDSFLLFGIQALTENRRAFLKFNRSLLVQQCATLLPKEQVVIEILKTVVPDARVISVCKELKEKGYMIALDEYVLRDRDKSNPLIDF